MASCTHVENHPERKKPNPIFLGFLIFLALFALCVHWNANACINGYEADLDALLSKRDSDEINEAIEQLQQAYQAKPSHKTANDLGIALVIAGKYPQAKEILKTAEVLNPGQAKTAFNLGTAFELAGDNAAALQWIEEGLRRDPTDHQGTEWLHVRILEAKIHLAQDPQWLNQHTVLGLSFGQEASPATPSQTLKDSTGKVLSLPDIQRAIDYQLHERLKFVVPPDPVVGDLFFAWGDLAWLTGHGDPRTYYSAAQNFHTHHTDVIAKRFKYYETQEDLIGWTTLLAWLCSPIGLFFGWRFYQARRRTKLLRS